MINKISSGSAKVVSSGTVIQFQNNPIEITIDLPSYSFNWILKFENNPNTSEQRIIADAPSTSTLVLTCYNFNNPIGSGTSQPVNIGTHGDQYVYVNFRVYSLSEDASKSVHYTVYLSEEKI